MATKLRLQLEDGRACTARPEAWIQAILSVMDDAARARVFELAAQFDQEQIRLYEPGNGARAHLADAALRELKKET